MRPAGRGATNKGTPVGEVNVKKRNPSRAKLIKEHTGHDPSGFPPRFNAILANEIEILRPPLTTWMCPFALTHPSAVEDEYLQVGLCDYVFTDIDYAVITFLFGISDPSKLKKSRWKAWLVSKCDISASELEKSSWPDIRELSLYGIEAEYNARRSRRGTTIHNPAGNQPVGPVSITNCEEWPNDLVTFAVAEQECNVSRSTLELAIKDGRLRSYRPAKCAKNSPHKVSRSQVASLWPRKGRRT